MLEALRERTVVIGNSGSGKSVFAKSLGAFVGAPVIDLDELHWEVGGYSHKRNENDARRMVRDVALEPRWIVDGVYGWLAEVALPRATALVWLDLPWALCRAGLLARDPRPGATEKDTTELLTWAEAYWTRQTPSSFAGHRRLFNVFSGPKFRLETRAAADDLLARLKGQEY